MNKVLNYLTGWAVIALSAPVMAGGYQLNDYSVTGLGRAYAGQGIMGDDYSAIAFNPAGMSLMKQSGMQTGITMVNLKSDIEGLKSTHGMDATGKTASMNYWAPIPQFFGQYNVNDKLSVGLGVYAPFGLKTEYDSDWYGSDMAILSKLDIIDINTALAYKFAPKWTVGAGFIARYIYGHMTNTMSYLGSPNAKSDFELDGWTVSGLFGLMYEPTDNTRFGLSYRLRSTQQVKGDHKLENTGLPGQDGTYTGWASPALPETVTFSAYHRYKDVGFSGTARWTHWSQSFPRFTMRSNSPLFKALLPNGEKTSDYQYDNSWTLTAGADWYYDKNWTFRCGTGWDESPTHNADNRTIRIPDNDRFWLSAGASYMLDNWQFDIAYAHMFGRAGEALETSDHIPTHTDVKYKNLQSHILGFQAQYKF